MIYLFLLSGFAQEPADASLAPLLECPPCNCEALPLAPDISLITYISAARFSATVDAGETPVGAPGETSVEVDQALELLDAIDALPPIEPLSILENN